jgi:Uma2 family endonuclease
MTTATAPAPVQTLPPSNGDEVLYEVIDGQWVKMPPMSIRASRVASRLQSRLGTFCHDHKLGEAVMETLFRLPLLPRHRDRRPDLAVIAAQRLAQATAQPEDENAWEVVPNLAVEVVSPSDLAEDLLEKIEEYFQAGVQLV